MHARASDGPTITSNAAAAPAIAPNPIATAKPLQMPAHNRWRYGGVATSATDARRNAIAAMRATLLRFAEQLANLRQQVDEIERLAQIAVGERAELHGAVRLIAIAVHGGHQEDRRRLPATLHLANELEAVLAWELDVDQAQIRRFAIEALDAFRSGRGRNGLVAVGCEEVGQDHLIDR